MNLPDIVKEKLVFLGASLADSFLVALSGGADSTALLLCMEQLVEGEGTLSAAHLDHGVRSGSGEDAGRVKALCQELGVPLLSGKVDPEELELRRREFGSLEAGMRELRYGFLFDAAQKMNSKWIVTGHHAEDQAETVLFRVTRGDNWRSLGGIPERRGNVLRPLADSLRKDILEYCLVSGVTPLTDPSNADEAFTRNRLRGTILPGLAASFHTGTADLLRRLGRAAGTLSSLEEDLLKRVQEEHGWPEDETLDLDLLTALPAILRKRAVLTFLFKATGQFPSRRLVQEVLEFALKGANGTLTMPGGRAFSLSYGKARVVEMEGLWGNALPLEGMDLGIPGKLDIPASGIFITARETVLEGPGGFPGGNTALLSKERLKGPLRVRRRLPGDCMRPLGMKGEKKLQDLFVDRKIPRERRDTIPVFVDREGDIIWVGGIAISSKAALEGFAGEEAVILSLNVDPVPTPFVFQRE